MVEDPFESCRNRIGRRVCVPFATYNPVPMRSVTSKEEKEECDINGLSLVTPGVKNLKEGSVSSGSRISSSTKAVSSPPSSDQPSVRIGHQQSGRKQRRCWSPELHRRFVNALQQLGGSQGRK